LSERLPPLRSLHIFSVAARTGSFKQAADELCVTPQAVSLQIKHLEEQLELPLFRRFKSGIELTASGELLLDYVQRGIELLEQGVRDVRQQHHRRQFRISASPWFAVNCLLPRLAEFEQQHPEVDIQLTTSVSFPDFNSQRLDLAIQWGFGSWRFSRKKLLLTDDKMLVCAASLQQGPYPIKSAEDLSHHRLICTELSVELWRQYLNTIGADLLVERQALVLDSHAGMLAATLKGLGVALLSVGDARLHCQNGDLIAPLGDHPLSEINPSLTPGYWLVQKENPRSDPFAAAFAEWLEEILAGHERRPREGANKPKSK